MNYTDHAMREFRAAGWTDKDGKFTDEMQEAICKHVLNLLEVFHDEGHSGSSAPYAINLFSRLAKFEPLCPLSGEDEEWNEVSLYSTKDENVKVYQNNRCSEVFKDSSYNDGKPYWIHGKVFWEWYQSPGETPFKSYFTSVDSRVIIEFPWNKPDTPEYVFRPTEHFPNEVL